MKLQILEPALAELEEATQYYEKHERGLGESFITEYGHCLDRISRYPNAWSLASANCRKCIFKRFPYAVVFSVVDEVILVVAIMHLSREPAYWVQRV